MGEKEINEFIRVMGTVDGRSFIYNFVLSSCGVDLASGIPSNIFSEYEIGRKKPAIDLFNLMFYHCPDKMNLMLKEQGAKNG